MQHGRPRRIELSLQVENGSVCLCVTDDGVGVQKARNGARGLGFHIMNYRARLMGGRLKVESPEKGGTRVACYVLDATIESNKRKKRAPEPLSAKLTKALGILI